MADGDKKTELVAVRVDEALAQAIDAEAERNHEGDRAPVMRLALRSYLLRETGTGHVARGLGRIVRTELRKFFRTHKGGQ